MNYQRKAFDEVNYIFSKNNVEHSHLDYYAWPETFGSTAGPIKGVLGGCAMTTFTVEAWVAQTGEAVMHCKGMFAFVSNGIDPFKTTVREWKTLDDFIDSVKGSLPLKGTWTCHICGATRSDDEISVRSKVININGLQVQENVRYCNDKESCIEESKTFSFYKEGQ